MSSMRSGGALALLFATALLLSNAAAQEAKPASTKDKTYTWSAELVSFDEPSRLMTVEARLERHAEIHERSTFSEGDLVLLTWTGLSRGVGISGISHGDEGGGALTMPAEFVAFDTRRDNPRFREEYVRFRVHVPDADGSELASLEPGDWVTVSVRAQGLEGWPGAVTEVRPFIATG